EKIGSVMRRKESISNVILIVLTDECHEVPSEYLDLPNAKNAPRLFLHDIDGIAHFLRNYFFVHPPAMLILAGGRSSRMGLDKSMLAYHGMPQVEYLTSIAEKMKMEAFVSVRDHSQSIPDSATAISDVLNNFGPLGGICSAYMHNPQRTWLVVAFDMPLVDIDLISEIMAADATMHDVVCFKSPNSHLPEPLLSLWKPSALRFAWNSIANGIRCPRKVIQQCNSLLLECRQPDKLANANTPEERVRLQMLLSTL
ncbi:MAG: NTP transferase domain-containing protein, partial [Flavobacteriales bacterium]